MSMAYIRRTYGVPAKRGQRVVANRRLGTITSASGPYIRIRLDGETRSTPHHPTWRIDYLGHPRREQLAVRRVETVELPGVSR